MNDQESEDRPAARRRDLWVKTLVTLAVWLGIIVAYRWVYSELGRSGWSDRLSAMAGDGGTRALALSIYTVLLIVCLLTPFSSAALIVLVALPVFGPEQTFISSIIAGGTSAVLSYWIGKQIRSGPGGVMLKRRLERIKGLVQSRRICVIAFACKAIPNPLYDLWGYAFGLARASFAWYLVGSLLGGAIPLGIMCFGTTR